jgi:CBS domain-containing protein
MEGNAMNVAAILKQKGRAITTARPTVTLMEVANKLAAKRIGAIVVVGAGGEVTMPVSQSMTKKVVTCKETDTLHELMTMMTERRFRHLPVVTDGSLVGIVSIGDVVKNYVVEMQTETTAIREYIAH